MITCDQVIAELGTYIDDEAATEIRRDLERHFAECRTCHAVYDSVRKTLKVVTESHTFELPEDLSERIVGRVMKAIRSEDT